ncbi:MAG: hypothetical protein KAS39_03060, partial [Actinomycetia bacterium]|nr:hypothetical protein [Actinomycetes bacterium]
INITTFGNPDFPRLNFNIDKVEPAFYKDILLFTRLESHISFPSESPTNEKTISLSSPIIWNWRTIMNMVDFGYAPNYILIDENNLIIDNATVNLRVFPSGAEDSFPLKLPNGKEFEVFVKIYSDYIDNEGEPASKSFNLESPRLDIKILSTSQKGTTTTLVSGLFSQNDIISVDKYSLVFNAILYYAVYRVISSSSIFFFIFSLIFLCLGLIWKVFFPRDRYFAYFETSKKVNKLYIVRIEDFFHSRIPQRVQEFCKRFEEGDL